MEMRKPAANFATGAFVFATLQVLTISAAAKTPVTFTSPCECIGNHGVSRWAAKTDLQEPPSDSTDIKKITPAHMLAWPGPGGHIDQRTQRIGSEDQWYAVTGRIEKVKTQEPLGASRSPTELRDG